VKGPQAVEDATARLDAALLGLDGFVVVATAEVGGELELLVETSADLVGCPGCGAVARAKDRRPTWVRDLPIGGRRWCCAGGSGSGAVRTRGVRSRPGPSGIRRSRLGRV
jgi:hypothetical protein